MRSLPHLLVLACAVASLPSALLLAADANQRLSYAQPATYWNSECLHVGNGYMGGSFYGGVAREIIELSEKSIWTGEPANGDWVAAGVNPKARETLPAIRRAVVEGRVKEADQLTTTHFLGDNKKFGNLTALGSLILEVGGAPAKPADYERVLDLTNALGSVAYTADEVRHTREYFCSYPDRVLAVRVASSKPGTLQTTVSLSLKQPVTTRADGRDLVARGHLKANGRPFQIRIKAIPTGGSVRAAGDKLVIERADALVLLVSIATNYRLHYPDYVGEDPELTTTRIIGNAAELGYETLKARHVQDFKSLYDRVAFTVAGRADAEQLPTDARLRAYRADASDPGLKALLFNLGRYLIISSSRPGTLPAHLQGVWNAYDTAPWAGNYQSNINLQEIYWSCGPTALLECQDAYVDWIKDLTQPGREVARRCYGTDGWVSHTTGNIYGSVAPYGGLSYAMFPMGAAWHCQHLWEHFAFSQDRRFLRDVAYPIMKEAAQFYAQNLTPYQERLIFVPSTSAEHGANSTPEGLRATSSSQAELYSMAAPMQDAQMLWDLFTNTIEAATLLDADADFRGLLGEKRAALFTPRVGRLGQLQEWAEDIDNPECHHRHIAHLYAVCPGRQIDPHRDAALAAAAKTSLELRRDGRFHSEDEASGGNWSLAHRMWSWGRLLEPERANAIFTRLIREQTFDNLLTYQQADYHFGRQDLFNEPSGVFCHFQLDASASVPGFIAEMLVQSHLGELSLLPALPAELSTGSVRGLRARGGIIVDLAWKDGQLTKATLHTPADRPLPPIRVKNHLVDPKTTPAIELRPLARR